MNGTPPLGPAPRRRSAVIARGVAVVAAAVVTLLLALTLALVAGGWPASDLLPLRWLSPQPAGPAEALTIALPTTPHAALLYIAASRGYFSAEGLTVTVLPVSHGKAAVDLVAQGRADLASAAEVPFVISVLQQAPLGIATSVLSVSREMAVVARRDRAIRAPRDLTGKRIGVTFGTSGEYFLWAFLIRHKLAPESVTLVDLAPGQLIKALESGQVDAAATWEPIKSRAVALLAENGLVFIEPDAYTVTHVVVGRNDFLLQRTKTVEKLIRALLRAEAFNREHPRAALLLVAEQLKLDVATLEAGWNDIVFEVDLRQSQLVTLEDEARWAMARGHARSGAVPNFLPHLHPEALRAVRPDRVTIVR